MPNQLLTKDGHTKVRPGIRVLSSKLVILVRQWINCHVGAPLKGVIPSGAVLQAERGISMRGHFDREIPPPAIGAGVRDEASVRMKFKATAVAFFMTGEWS
jgi:hypothetical protein